MSNKIEDMTNKDLIEYCKDEGIDIDSKNVTKPTKKELLASIKKFELEQYGDADELLAVDEPVEEKAEKVKVNKNSKKITRAQKRRKQYDELMPLKRVLVTSNATNQTLKKLHFITWGNGLIGHQTDRVYLGKPWHVREGALRNLENAIITEAVQDDDNNRVTYETKPAFNVRRLPALTEGEIEKIAKRQTIRDSSIESLI